MSIPGPKAFANPSMDEFAARTTVHLPSLIKASILHSDLDGSNIAYLPVNAGEMVRSIIIRVKTAFDVATDVLVGIASDTDALVPTGVLNPGTLNLVIDSKAQAGASNDGIYFASAGDIRLTFNGNPTAGELEVLLEVINLSQSWRELAA